MPQKPSPAGRRASSAEARRGDLQRAFIALQPSSAALSEIRSLEEEIARTESGGRFRLTPRERLHVTLAFLGDTTKTERDAVLGILRDFDPPPAIVAFDRLGSFPKSNILWLSGRNPVLSASARAIRRMLRESGIRFDEKPFREHITLARNWQGPVPALSFEPIAWKLEPPRLMLSVRSADGKLLYIPA